VPSKIKTFNIAVFILSTLLVQSVGTRSGHAVMGGVHATDTKISEEKSDAFEVYVSEGGYFKVALPSAWGKSDESFGLSAEEKKVYGVDVLGPSSNDGIAAMIAVHYYAPGNLLYETMEGFINIHAQPALGVNLDGREYGRVRVEMVAGRSAKVFERKVYEYIPPDAFKPKKIAVYERFVVMPANKGFYVVRYSAPEDIAEKYKPVFKKVISSFEPLIK
jgi:hypothetical protein